MINIRTVPETDLVIIGGYVEPALAHDFQDEWVEQLRPEQRAKLEYTQRGFFDEDYSVGEVLRRPELPASHRILRLLGFTPDEESSIGLNFQSPLGAQNFHVDNPTLDQRVYVIQGADGGVFDYAPKARSEQVARASHLSIEVNAGDVLIQTEQQLIHRGRNGVNSPRVTAAIARVDFDQFYDLYI